MSVTATVAQHGKMVVREGKLLITVFSDRMLGLLFQCQSAYTRARIAYEQVHLVLMPIESDNSQLVGYRGELDTRNIAICIHRKIHRADNVTLNVVGLNRYL